MSAPYRCDIVEVNGTTHSSSNPLYVSPVSGSAIAGDVAHDAVDSGNPLKIGFKAYDPDTPPSAVSAGDRANAISDLRGRIITYLGTALSSTIDSIQANQGPSVNAQNNWTICQATNGTTAGTTFPALAPTASAPTASSTRCVITWAGRDNLLLQFFGVGANNATFKFRVTGWTTDGTNWYPGVICDGTATLTSSITGISGQTPSNSNYFADGIALGAGATGYGAAVVVSNPADDTGVAVLRVNIGSWQRVEIQFILNGSATSCNGFYQTY